MDWASFICSPEASSPFSETGEQFTNIKVFELPPMESLRSCVNLWLRYGICLINENILGK